MRVILLSDVRGVGRKNDVKEVADGYARNFLVAKKLAVAADEKGMGAKAQVDAKEEAERLRLAALAARLSTITLDFTMKTGPHGELFGSVSKRDVEMALREKGFVEGEIILEHPIKSTGEQKVEVDFGKGARGVLKVVIHVK